MLFEAQLKLQKKPHGCSLLWNQTVGLAAWVFLVFLKSIVEYVLLVLTQHFWYFAGCTSPFWIFCWFDPERWTLGTTAWFFLGFQAGPCRSPSGRRDDFQRRTEGVEWSSRMNVWINIWVWINTYENTIFSGMNIHKSQLFWCELQGYKVLTHCHKHIYIYIWCIYIIYLSNHLIYWSTDGLIYWSIDLSICLFIYLSIHPWSTPYVSSNLWQKGFNRL